METKKKHWIIGLIVLSMFVLGGLGFVQAWGIGGFVGKEPHPKCLGMGFRPGRHGKHFPEQFLTVLDFKIGALDLSDIQKEKYGVIRAELKGRLTEGMKKREEAIGNLRQKISQPDPNMRDLAELIKNQMKGMLRFMERNIDDFVQLYEMLDDKQKNQVIENLREHFDRSAG